jgi:hypothetical protein
MLTVINGPIIRAGEALSEPIDCSAGQIVRITMPTDWTFAALTFQFSTDGQFFNEMYGLDGFAVTIKTVVPGSGVIIPEEIGRAIAWIKFRSGHEGNPIPQEADRNFAVAIYSEGEAAAPAAFKLKPRRVSEKKPAAKKAAKKHR